MRVLVTGATGRIGRVVLDDLLNRGHQVRATSSKAALREPYSPLLEWRTIDFAQSTDVDELVSGCDAIIHLAAELHDPVRMQRVNVDATQSLADAAERFNVRSFCYSSSVAVYGSAKNRVCSEDSPVLTVDRDIASEYWVTEYVRRYGRTKLAGEMAIEKVACMCHFVVFRPSVVVDIPDIIAVRDWGIIKRVMAAHRHAHHIYVRDVSHALIWAIETGMNDTRSPGRVDVYNLAEDDFSSPTYGEFMVKAYAVCGDARFDVYQTPGLLDWIRDFLRYRKLPIRNPLWRMIFPNQKLKEVGFRLPFGMARAHELALEVLQSEL